MALICFRNDDAHTCLIIGSALFVRYKLGEHLVHQGHVPWSDACSGLIVDFLVEFAFACRDNSDKHLIASDRTTCSSVSLHRADRGRLIVRQERLIDHFCRSCDLLLGLAFLTHFAAVFQGNR